MTASKRRSLNSGDIVRVVGKPKGSPLYPYQPLGSKRYLEKGDMFVVCQYQQHTQRVLYNVWDAAGNKAGQNIIDSAFVEVVRPDELVHYAYLAKKQPPQKYVVLRNPGGVASEYRKGKSATGEIVSVREYTQEGTRCVYEAHDGAGRRIALRDLFPLSRITEGANAGCKPGNLQPGDKIRVIKKPPYICGTPDDSTGVQIGDVLTVANHGCLDNKSRPCVMYKRQLQNHQIPLDCVELVQEAPQPGDTVRYTGGASPGDQPYHPEEDRNLEPGECVTVARVDNSNGDVWYNLHHRWGEENFIARHNYELMSIHPKQGTKFDPITQSCIDEEDRRFLDAVNQTIGETEMEHVKFTTAKLIGKLKDIVAAVAKKNAASKVAETAARAMAVVQMDELLNADDPAAKTEVEFDYFDVSTKKVETMIATLELADGDTIELKSSVVQDALKLLDRDPVKHAFVLRWAINDVE